MRRDSRLFKFASVALVVALVAQLDAPYVALAVEADQLGDVVATGTPLSGEKDEDVAPVVNGDPTPGEDPDADENGVAVTSVGDPTGVTPTSLDGEEDPNAGISLLDVGDPEDTPVAKIGDTDYATLQEAIANVGYGQIITIQRDVDNAVGISVASGKNFTIDFGGYTYTLSDPGAGSTGTETNGFQLLKDSTIIMKNGIVRIAEESTSIMRIIQNYANLTLEDMTFYTENQSGDLGENYALSFNHGNVVIKGKTSVINSEGASTDTVAFDVFFWNNDSYKDGVSVTFDQSYTGTIDGTIIYDSTDEAKAKLVVDGAGSFGAIKASDSSTDNPNIEVSGGTFETPLDSTYCAEGFAPQPVEINGEIVYTVVGGTGIATIGGTSYDTLQAAIDAVVNGDASGEIVLQKNVVESVTIPDGANVTLNLNGRRISNTDKEHTIINSGTLTITDANDGAAGTVDNISHAKAALFNENGATCTVLAGNFTRSFENGQSTEDSGGNSFYTINNYGAMTFGTAATDADNSRIKVTANGHYSSLVHNGWYDSKDAQGKQADMTIYGGTFTGGINTIKNDESGFLTVNGGTFENVTQYAVMNWNEATINDGTFNSSASAVFNGSDSGTSVGKLTIIGGSFNYNTNYYGVTSYASTTITGGTYSTQHVCSDDPSRYAPGLTPSANGGGGYSLVPVTADNATVSIKSAGGDMAYYASLMGAIDAAKGGDTITLLKDASASLNDTKDAYDDSLWIEGNNITLDLAGHTVTSRSNTGGSYNVLNLIGNNNTIKNGTVKALRLNDSTDGYVSDSYAFAIEGSGTVENVKTEGGIATYGSGPVTVCGNETDVQATDYYAIYAEGPTVNVEGGMFRANPDKGALLYANSGDDDGEVYTSIINITGGTFDGQLALENNPGVITVSGGSFDRAVDVNYCVEGYEPVSEPGSDGRYSVVASDVASVISGGVETRYKTFSEAYQAAKDGDVITLLRGAEWVETPKTAEFKIEKTVTIDLNGNRLELVRANSEKGFYLNVTGSGKTLTINDSSFDQSGVLTTTYDTYVVRLSGGDAVLNGGTLYTDVATSVVQAYSSKSTFTMNGGQLVSNKAKDGSSNNTVLYVQNGTAVINGGSILATNGTDPVPGVKAEHDLTVNEGTISAGGASAIWWKGSGAETLTICGGKIESPIQVDSTGPVVIGSDDTAADSLELPSLVIGKSGVVTVHDNVHVESVTGVDGGTYTFKFDNAFGGTYGCDFTSYIIGNGLECVEQADGSYTVSPISVGDERIVAVITRRGGSEALFCDFGAAMAALNDGDKLTLRQDVSNSSSSPWTAKASNVTLDLNGHSINSSNASGLRFYPDDDEVVSGGTVKIEGKGSISGATAAVYCGTNGSRGENLYTLSIGSDVTVKLNEDGGSGSPINLASDQVRLCLDIAQNDEMYNYAAMTNAVVKTLLEGKAYIYRSPSRALNDLASDDGTVYLIGDLTSSTPLTVTNEYAVRLDLGGHVLTLKSQQGVVSNGNGLTIENGTVSSLYSSTSTKSYATIVGATAGGTNGASLTLRNVTLESGYDRVTALTVNGSLQGVKVTLDNCKISCIGIESVGVYFPVKDGVLDIVDTEITAANAVQVKGGVVTVTETETGKTSITSTGAKAAASSTVNGCTNTGDGIYVEDTYGFAPVVYVQHGAVKSDNGTALQYFDNSQDDAVGKIEVSGGDFSHAVPAGYCANGYVPTDADDDSGLYSVSAGPKFYARTLTLDGRIGVNFYVDMEGIPEAERESYSMQFTVNGNSVEPVEYRSDEMNSFDGKTYYRFTCLVDSRQMADEVTAQLCKDGQPVSKVYTYSVKAYADKMMSSSSDSKLTELLTAMLNYGGYAQTFFKYKTDNLANRDLGSDVIASVKEASVPDSYASEPSDSLPNGLSNPCATLLLDSEVSIRLYVTLGAGSDIESYSFWVDGQEVSPKQCLTANEKNNGDYYVETEGIQASQLDATHTLGVGPAGGEPTWTLSYSALTYAYNMSNPDSEADEALKDLAKALYLYNVAADNYDGWVDK